MLQRRKALSLLVLFALLGGLLAGCASNGRINDPRTVVVAVVEDDPGSAGNPNPQSAYAGIALAVSQMRDQWNLNLQVVPYADGGDPNTARQVAEQVVQSEAVAVIGHASIETSSAAAEIYEAAGLPVLNFVPVTEDLTARYGHFFNTTYTAESEAAYVANYLRRIDNAQTASVVYTDDGYGQTLASHFRNTFRGLGGRISVDSPVSASNPADLEAVISKIIAANPETENPGTIFIATDDRTAAQLVIQMKQKGVSYPIAGGSSLSSPDFLRIIREQAEETTIPGYYTDGILATRALIFDSANRYANQFRFEYQQAYRVEPGDRVVNGYDAALVILAAIRDSDVGGGAGAEDDRAKLYDALLSINESRNAVQGMISPVYFEPSRNIIRAARFGIYQNGKMVSANTQFEPLTSPNEVNDLQSQLAKGRVMTVNGDYVYKANVVYAGVDLLGIEEIDIKTSTYKMDFYLWFRYRPNEQDKEFTPDDFVFTNAASGVESVLIREELNPDNTFLRTYRVSGVFKNQFQFQAYPFDRQNLVVEFRNQNANTSFIQYVVDQIGMRYEDETVLLRNFSDNGAFDSVYGWNVRGVQVTQDIFPTYSTFGIPENFDRKLATNYSLINVNVDVQRSSLQYIIKSLLPLLITLVLAYITFFLPLGHSERLAVGSTALLTTAFFHLTLADALPEIGYTVAMEYLFYASYLMSALIVLLETLSIRYEKFGEETGEKADKDRFKEQRERLNKFGKIIYPAILLVVLAAGFFVYTGAITLDPQTVESRQLVDFIVTREPALLANAPLEESVDAGAVTVKLTMATWRPEDSAQIQVLLDAFNVYARETLGREIVIEHEPIVSVNYDSILDIQLSRRQGPDLLYVRPFSVDGNISKYLAPLNDLPIDVNYDATKIAPWKDRVGNYYAVPYVGVVQGVFYNRELFDTYGLAVPQTWGEFLRILEIIKSKQDAPGIVPIANGFNQDEDSDMFMSLAANFLGGPNGRSQLMRMDGKSLCYDNPRVVNLFKAVQDLKPYLPANVSTIRSTASQELFLNGQAVMLFGGSYNLQTISERAKFKWGVFAVPAQVLQQTYVIFQPDIAIGVNRDSARQEEARIFLEWLMTKEAVNLTAQNLAGFYPLNINPPRTGSGTDDQKFLDLVRLYPGDIRWMFTEISNKTPAASDLIRRDLYRIMAFGLTPLEAAQNLQKGLGEWYEPAQSCQ